MKSCYCPSCGASLDIDSKDHEVGSCPYCGAKVMLDDYRSSHHIVDEARIKEAETEQVVRLKELEIEEMDRARIRKGRLIAYGLLLLAIIVTVIIYAINNDPGMMAILMLEIIGIVIIAVKSMKQSKKRK